MRTLGTTAISIATADDVTSSSLGTVLSIAMSPLPLEPVINYGVSRVYCYMDEEDPHW